MRHYLCWLLLTLPGIAPAEVYSHRDASGTPMFSDRAPHDGAQPLSQNPINRMPATVPPTTPRVATMARTEQRPAYQQVAILFPAADAAHSDPTGDLRVEASSVPALLPGHSYRLLLDGQTWPAGLELHNLDRGSHRLTVQIVDATGRVLAGSAEQVVHIQRPSLIHKRRRRPCEATAEHRQRPECQPSQLPSHQ